MERILTYHVSPTEDGQTLQAFLKSRHFSTKSIITLKKDPKAFYINACPAFANAVLHAGDEVIITIREKAFSEKIAPIPLPIEIVYEDDDLLVVNKPANMPIHPSMNNYDNSLANALAYYYEQKGCPFVFRCITRLDRDTSGLTLIAKHHISAAILSEMVAAKASGDGIHREYIALVRGKLTPSSGTINAPIGRKPGSVIERCVDYENGETAVTHYNLVEYKNGHSLVSLKLETGRTHQIRVHMKYLGFPLIGDYLYNPDTEFINRQALHSCKLCFRHPITGEEMVFTSPLPKELADVLYHE